VGHQIDVSSNIGDIVCEHFVHTYEIAADFRFSVTNQHTIVAAQAVIGKYAGEFMAIGVGGRALGLGGAYTALAGDATAGYWNPAGLASFEAGHGLQIGAMHAEWFAGVGKFDYLGMTLPSASGKRRIGISLIRFGIDDIPNTLSLFDDDGTIWYGTC